MSNYFKLDSDDGYMSNVFLARSCAMLYVRLFKVDISKGLYVPFF